VKVPYKLTAAVKEEIRHAQMAEALKTGYPRLEALPIDNYAAISIACYGPSLADTWQDMRHPIISVSGALHFLAERGVIPDFHVDCDPRPHKMKHLQPIVPSVHYIMGTCCHPTTWPLLEGQKVSLAHFYMGPNTSDWVATYDKGKLLIHPGSTVGLSAIHVGGMLGYRHFEIHGMDGSFKDGKRHAGPHYGHAQGGITWQAGNVKYDTSRIMSNACAEVINSFRLFPIFGVFHGKGLQQALIDEEYGMENVALAGTPKAQMIRGYKAVMLGELQPA